MRWTHWLLALAGVAQFAVMAAIKPTGYVSLDMAYLVMWLTLIAAVALWWGSCCSWGGYCGYGGGCDCGHCEGCKGDDCCGECACCKDDGDGHEHGHEGHDHPH